MLGHRDDINELCNGADVFALPSFQEGLSVALMEAMACGKAVVCSKIRGNIDLIDEGQGGFFFNPYSVEDVISALRKIQKANREILGLYNIQKVKSFEISNVIKQEENIYDELTEEISQSHKF